MRRRTDLFAGNMIGTIEANPETQIVLVATDLAFADLRYRNIGLAHACHPRLILLLYDSSQRS